MVGMYRRFHILTCPVERFRTTRGDDFGLNLLGLGCIPIGLVGCIECAFYVARNCRVVPLERRLRWAGGFLNHARYVLFHVLPQTTTLPSLLSNTVCLHPAATCVYLVSPSRAGMVLWPRLLSPHATTLPSAFSNTVWHIPAAIVVQGSHALWLQQADSL